MRIKIRQRTWLDVSFGGFTSEERSWYEPPRLYLNVLRWHLSIDLPVPYRQPIVQQPCRHAVAEAPADGRIACGEVTGSYRAWNRLGICHYSNRALTWMTPTELAAYEAEQRAARA